MDSQAGHALESENLALHRLRDILSLAFERGMDKKRLEKAIQHLRSNPRIQANPELLWRSSRLRMKNKTELVEAFVDLVVGLYF